LFSRIFYDAKSLDDFPNSISRHVKKDYKNRYYEDFYRVIYQNERFEDWTPTLIILKRLIKEYRDYILNYHKRQFGSSLKMPAGSLSSAAEGNFLETLILSSNVFERHFIDRPFDRTGMMSLVITPGNGLFEVSRELSKITKERVIDNAIGSDLVCLGEQPLHSVPLFKYETPESYDIAHWINLSFYKSSETVRYCNSKFLPNSKIKIKFKSKGLPDSILPDYKPDLNNYLKSLEETDNMFENQNKNVYTQDVLTNIKNNANNNNIRPTSRTNTSSNFNTSQQNNNSQINQSNNGSLNRTLLKKNKNNINNISVNVTNPSSTNTTTTTTSTSTPNNNNNKRSNVTLQDDVNKDQNSLSDDQTTENDDDSSLELESDNEVNHQESASNGQKRVKSKVNPFQPSSIRPKMSFERRRWAHTFPLRSDGTPIYQHWISVRPYPEYSTTNNNNGQALSVFSNNNNMINSTTTPTPNTNSSDINSEIIKISPDSIRTANQNARNKIYE
jgi:DEP domain-containing protein 5